ncbi:hypothetical protein Sjap_011394 [Stephania japonica]|uniref:Uncharacterized protein n=1 Tax=Stephania japonica TaxID=461633 RepID=A0AAP0JDF4_9MAGN
MEDMLCRAKWDALSVEFVGNFFTQSDESIYLSSTKEFSIKKKKSSAVVDEEQQRTWWCREDD